MMTNRSLILHWIESGAVPRDRVDDALALGEVLPTSKSWRMFVDRLLLFSGALALAAAVIFFLAYNWDAMGRFAKFGLVEALIVIALAAYWRLGAERLAGKAALTVAALLVGALFALFGQTYQTGADPWQLFANWALMILPWVIIARLAALWIVWLALLNTALGLYFSTFNGLFGILFSQEAQLYSAFALNTLALIAFELGARRFAWRESIGMHSAATPRTVCASASKMQGLRFASRAAANRPGSSPTVAASSRSWRTSS